MQWKNTEKHYGFITQSFHWAVVTLIVIHFALGFTMGAIPKEGDKTIWGMSHMDWFHMHQSFGFLMLLVVIGRIAWRWSSTLPEWAAGLSRGERIYAHYVERILYWLMALTPLTGMIATMAFAGSVYFFGVEIPGFVPQNKTLGMGIGVAHAITRMSLILVAFMHIGLVLKHQFINKDRLMNRMLPFN